MVNNKEYDIEKLSVSEIHSYSDFKKYREEMHKVFKVDHLTAYQFLLVDIAELLGDKNNGK